MSKGLAVAQIEVEKLFDRGSGKFSLITQPIQGMGKITLTNGSDQLIGVGTLFIGDSGFSTLNYWSTFIVDGIFYFINSIEDETHATLSETWTGDDKTVDLIFLRNTASYNSSIALGLEAECYGENSIAFGNSTCSANNSLALGGSVSESYAIAFPGSFANGEFSFAGAGGITSGFRSVAIGNGMTAPSAGECALGTYGVQYTPASTTSFNSADRAFTVGIGADENNREDGLVVWKSGLVDAPGNTIRLRTNRTITNGGDTGTVGEICWDSSYVYVCVATNTWKRTLLLTW